MDEDTVLKTADREIWGFDSLFFRNVSMAKIVTHQLANLIYQSASLC